MPAVALRRGPGCRQRNRWQGWDKMVESGPQITISRGQQDKLIVQRGEKKAVLRYQEAFALGHSWFQAGQYVMAQDVFAALAGIGGRGPRATIMLARCKAEIDSFEACDGILQAIFDGDEKPVAEELQAAFVFHTMGMRDDAIREMVKLVKTHPNLPTAFLYLGDLYFERGSHDKAAYCWRLAVSRDRRDGAVAITARRQLGQLVKRMKRADKRAT